MNCPSCQHPLDSGQKTCPSCGFAGSERPQVLVEASKRVAVVGAADNTAKGGDVPAAWAMPAGVVASSPVNVEPEDSTVPTLPPQPAESAVEPVSVNDANAAAPDFATAAGGDSATVADGDSAVRAGLADDLAREAIPAGTDTIVDVHRRVVLARTWRRLLAATVDLLAVLTLSSLYLTIAIARLPDGVGPARGTGFDRLIDGALVYHQATLPGVAVFLVLLVVYEAVFVRILGQTPGLLLLRCHVISARSRQISWPQSLLRALAAAAGLLLLGIGWSMQLTNLRHQSLHDCLAGTLVGLATDEITTLVVEAPRPDPESVEAALPSGA